MAFFCGFPSPFFGAVCLDVRTSTFCQRYWVFRIKPLKVIYPLLRIPTFFRAFLGNPIGFSWYIPNLFEQRPGRSFRGYLEHRRFRHPMFWPNGSCLRRRGHDQRERSQHRGLPVPRLEPKSQLPYGDFCFFCTPESSNYPLFFFFRGIMSTLKKRFRIFVSISPKLQLPGLFSGYHVDFFGTLEMGGSKLNSAGANRRFWSMFPLTRFDFGAGFLSHGQMLLYPRKLQFFRGIMSTLNF